MHFLKLNHSLQAQKFNQFYIAAKPCGGPSNCIKGLRKHHLTLKIFGALPSFAFNNYSHDTHPLPELFIVPVIIMLSLYHPLGFGIMY